MVYTGSEEHFFMGIWKQVMQNSMVLHLEKTVSLNQGARSYEILRLDVIFLDRKEYKVKYCEFFMIYELLVLYISSKLNFWKQIYVFRNFFCKIEKNITSIFQFIWKHLQTNERFRTNAVIVLFLELHETVFSIPQEIVTPTIQLKVFYYQI